MKKFTCLVELEIGPIKGKALSILTRHWVGTC